MGSDVDSSMAREGDALFVIDVQRDFLPGGALAVLHGDEVVAPLNRCIDAFVARRLPIFATRDWHPPNHCSFAPQGGSWPVHCVMNTRGAEFSPQLRLPAHVEVISKGTDVNRDAYSDFSQPACRPRLLELGVRRLWIGGLATEYCVLYTVRDAIACGFEVLLLTDAVRAIEQPAGELAIKEMQRLGARCAVVPS